MTLTFLGTRGEIEARTPQHHMHSSLVAQARSKAVMIDCGADWTGRLAEIDPAAILITHAHSDHAAGLKGGAQCPIYATAQAWSGMRAGPVARKVIVEPGRVFQVAGIEFEAFVVEHSIRAPAVGYRIAAGPHAVFYVPDVVRICGQQRALRNIDVYIGDGASISRPIFRRRGDVIIGHAPIRTQLEWCREEGVRRAVFTHCGSQIVKGDRAAVAERVRTLGEEAGVEAEIAYDGMKLRL